MTPREVIPAHIPEEVEMEVENALKGLIEAAAPKANTIRLSREDVEEAKRLGISPLQYAREKYPEKFQIRRPACTKNGSVFLTTMEEQIADDLGMPRDEYLKNKRLLLLAGRIGTTKESAAYQRKLERDREYSRAYRARKKTAGMGGL